MSKDPQKSGKTLVQHFIGALKRVGQAISKHISISPEDRDILTAEGCSADIAGKCPTPEERVAAQKRCNARSLGCNKR